MKPVFVFLMLSASLPSAHAHDLWLEKSDKQYTLFQGHRHSTHAGTETMEYGTQFVASATCFDARGGKRSLAVGGAAPWTARGDCAVLMLDVSSGYWSKTPWETRNVPKTEVKGALKSWLSKESLKRFDAWSAALAQPLGAGFEIVPTSDPFTLKPDDKLVVRVVYGGKPLADVPVAYHGETRGATDPDGRIAIRLRHGGVQLIAASIELPLNDGKADIESIAATLQFELPK